MSWREDVVYAPNTPALRAALEAHPALGPQLHLIPQAAVPRSRLPEGGLLAVRSLIPPESIEHADAVPWDALWGPDEQPLRFPDPESDEALEAWLWPPPQALRCLAALAEQTGTPLAYHRGETWGGTPEHEVTWVFGPSHVWVAGSRDGALRFRDGEREPAAGGALMIGLTEIGVQVTSGFFEPHTRSFDWDAARLRPRAPRGAPLPPQPLSLHRSVAQGDLDSARRLLERGADPNAYARRRPLELAAALGALDLVELLLSHGAEVKNGGYNPLRVASTAAVAERLLQAGAPAQGGLRDAARRGHGAVVEVLLQAGALVDFDDDKHALWYAACAGGLVELAARGLEAGVDLHVRAPGAFANRSGLELAAEGGRAAMVRWLLARGARLTEAAVAGCAREGHAALLAELLDRGGSVESKRHGRRALYEAARAGALDCVTLLVERGADVNATSQSGDTALHGAALTGQREIVRYLLDRGAAVDPPSDVGYTPLWSAVGHGDQALADLLIAAGADPDVSNKWGVPLRQLAAQREIVLPPKAR